MDGTSRAYDVVVLGAGPAGENLAERTRAAGLTTVIVENELLGGECSFWACEPSKALLRPVVARADARRVPGLRRAVEGPLDVPAVFAYRDKMSAYWQDDDQVDWLDSVSVDLVRGYGRLDGPRQVVVDLADGGSVRLTARHAVGVSTGTVTAFPDLPGLERVRPWTNRDATAARHVPDRLVVVGGGVVAVEMATAFQALGSQVTLLVRGDKGLLNRMEPFAGEMVADALRAAGADLRFGTSVTAVAREDGADGPVHVTLDDGSSLVGDEILFATGRAPHTTDIGLETVGLSPGDWLTVDDSYRVTDIADGWLYAVGDVNHRALMTHQGKYQARIAGAVIGARAKGDAARRRPLGQARLDRRQRRCAAGGLLRAGGDQCRADHAGSGADGPPGGRRGLRHRPGRRRGSVCRRLPRQGPCADRHRSRHGGRCDLRRSWDSGTPVLGDGGDRE
ncbi:pyruvate/2-oxoglutarate dehydrogenase complex dihydrolipoamide dehydrogenase (E3) component [Streptomyces canus]|nr:pyruvate/2-oxoglutarate dehydrogenase complex dihydrolipoamide dehydrogenase (E3) component [Streptomyces canus]